MTLNEIIPAIRSFSQAEKFKLVKILLDQIELEENLEKSKGSKIAYEDDPLWDIVGMVKEDVTDMSLKHDEYLYGKDPL